MSRWTTNTNIMHRVSAMISTTFALSSNTVGSSIIIHLEQVLKSDFDQQRNLVVVRQKYVPRILS